LRNFSKFIDDIYLNNVKQSLTCAAHCIHIAGQ